MLDDSDVHWHRQIKGAVGGVAASVTGDPAVFVSVSAAHQGPDGGGPVAAIVDLGPGRPTGYLGRWRLNRGYRGVLGRHRHRRAGRDGRAVRLRRRNWRQGGCHGRPHRGACWSPSWPCSTGGRVRRDPHRQDVAPGDGHDNRAGRAARPACLHLSRLDASLEPEARPVPVPRRWPLQPPWPIVQTRGRRPRRTGRVRHRGRRPADARIRPPPPGVGRGSAPGHAPRWYRSGPPTRHVLSDSGATMARRKWRLSHPHRPSRPSGPGRGSPLTGAVSTGSLRVRACRRLMGAGRAR